MVPVDLWSRVDGPQHIRLHPWCKLGLCRRFPIPKNIRKAFAINKLQKQFMRKSRVFDRAGRFKTSI